MKPSMQRAFGFNVILMTVLNLFFWLGLLYGAMVILRQFFPGLFQ